MSVFDNWDKTKTALLEGLASPSTAAMMDRLLESQRVSMEAMYIQYAPQREFNAARKARIDKIRIKRNLLNRRRKSLGLKPYRPTISVFQKRQKDTQDLPMIRRVIPGCIAFDIPEPLTPPENVSHIFGMRINRNMEGA
jgi:hypothetical protein